MARAMVLEKHTANCVERALGMRTYGVEREWIGCEIWHEAGYGLRAPRKLATLLASRRATMAANTNEAKEDKRCNMFWFKEE